ncbi:MAG: DUF2817 domain-containing protein, partial [Alphaproteobacteria bacterium]
MAIAGYFARDPAAARAQFLRAAGAIGLAVATHRMPAAGGGVADVLAARLGSPEARRLLVLTPGSKQEDALCATAIAVASLRERLRRSIPRGVAMILLQADDPVRVLAPDTAQVSDEETGQGPRWTDSVLAAAENRYADYQRGQHAAVPSSPAEAAASGVPGAGFGRLVETEMGQAERVAVLDVTTGRGAYGQCDLVVGHPAGSPGEARARRLFSARPLADGSSTVAMPGPLARGIVSALSEAETTVAVLAFGTYSVRAVVHSMLGRPAEGQSAASGMF